MRKFRSYRFKTNPAIENSKSTCEQNQIERIITGFYRFLSIKYLNNAPPSKLKAVTKKCTYVAKQFVTATSAQDAFVQKNTPALSEES